MPWWYFHQSKQDSFRERASWLQTCKAHDGNTTNSTASFPFYHCAPPPQAGPKQLSNTHTVKWLQHKRVVSVQTSSFSWCTTKKFQSLYDVEQRYPRQPSHPPPCVKLPREPLNESWERNSSQPFNRLQKVLPLVCKLALRSSSGTFVTNLHLKAKHSYEVRHFSKRYSQNICSGFHRQADKMALFKKSYPLVHKKIMYLPTI